MKGKLNAIDLFSGYGGITLALEEYVRPLIYCEIERYPQAVLLSRMEDETLPFAPIWDDVTTLNGRTFNGVADIVYGGFPCQDISVAGKGAGLAGERSGLFSEVIRICKEASPTFIFLENVPAIRKRGSIEVQEQLASIGYDTRFGCISAAEVGANHQRDRWFCLAIKRSGVAHSEGGNDGRCNPRESEGQIQQPGIGGGEKYLAHSCGEGSQGLRGPERIQAEESGVDRIADAVNLADADLQRRSGEASSGQKEDNKGIGQGYGRSMSPALDRSWWETEPSVGRVAHGSSVRAHRIKALGNGVVPLQVKTAFEILMGIRK